VASSLLISLCAIASLFWIAFFCRCLNRSSQIEKRAAMLLCDWLSPSQRAQYEHKRYFEVRGSASGKRYRICQGRIGNIIELDERGGMVATLCFLPEGDLASGDIMLAQKIALEADELAAVRVANRTVIDG